LQALPDPRRALRLALRATPDRLSAAVLARAVSSLFAAQGLADQLDEVEGLRVALTVTDTGNHVRLKIERRRVLSAGPGSPCDLRLRGTSDDFLRLALRLEDPDTLFFQRRLSLEGGTESGLYIKNLLDAVELDARALGRASLGANLGDRLGRWMSSPRWTAWADAIRRDCRRRLDETAGAAAERAMAGQTSSPARPHDH